MHYSKGLISITTGELDSGPKLTIDEATAMLQKHERARQGRLRAKLMQEIRTQEKKVASIVEKSANKNTTETMAARRIQAHWRGVVARKKVKKKREDELVFIGMVIDLKNHYLDSDLPT